MSSRTLARRFRAETGNSVQDWIARPHQRGEVRGKIVYCFLAKT